MTEHRQTVPPALPELVMKCLEKKPADRWQSAEELLRELDTSLTPSAGATPTGATPVSPAKHTWRMAAAAAALVAIVAVAVSVWPGGPEPAGPPRLVVLPFDNLGAPGDEYFADGMTQEITSRLARLSGIEVIARTSAMQYKDTDETAAQIAAELNADYLLEGTVRWHRPDSGKSRLRISPQLNPRIGRST